MEAIREALRTTLTLFDFQNQSLEQVVDKALAMDRMHNNNTMNLSMLHRNLPTLEEFRFRQVVKCTTCLNIGHSTVECSLRTHCTICHSKVYLVKQCEYNQLNKTPAPVREIHPENNYQENRNQLHDDDQSRYDDRYQSERRVDYQREDYHKDDN